MPKLIDAESAKDCIEVTPEGTLSRWQEGYLAASISAVHQIDLLPDASGPLRARIKELEEFIAKVANAGNSLEWETLIDEAKRKGGHDV